MISLYFSGDVMIGRSFNKLFSHYPNFNIWGNTADRTKNSDFFGINLETTITDHDIKFPNKVFNYKLSSKYKSILTKSGVTYANLANNHIMDYMENGLIETINNLDSLNINHSGAGKTIKEAMVPVIINIKGLTIGIISASDHPKYFKSEVNKPGIDYIDLENEKIKNRYIKYVKKLKKHVDILIFSIHHGYNYVSKIPQKIIDFFRSLVDNGVDIIHGHSAHHILPIEKYKNSYIFYSMGDYIDDYTVSDEYRNDLGFLAKINIINKKIHNIKIYPTKITIEHKNNILIPQVNFIKESDHDYDLVFSKIKYII